MEVVIYFTKITEEDQKKRLSHMVGECLLREGLKRGYGLDLDHEPRGRGEHGKPFLTLRPQIHYNITHSGGYAACAMSDQEIGIDIQEHRKVNYARLLERIVPTDMVSEILDSDDPERAFYIQWVLREAYIKWTGEGLSRDLRTIDLQNGFYTLLDVDEGYSGAVWMAKPREIRWEYVPVELD